MADLTLLNLNMLFMRYGEEIEKEAHVPLGCLYLSKALENEGYKVDFRDYQMSDYEDPFDLNNLIEYLADPAEIIGLSCMANLLPFTINAIKEIKKAFPGKKIILGGVGAKAVENKILERFPWIDLISRGEAEKSGIQLIEALLKNKSLETVLGISYREGDKIFHNPDCNRITDLDQIAFPAFEKIELSKYAGYGIMTSRGCPYPCTFCSVAPVWNLESYSRTPKNIVDEMEYLNKEAGVDLFLFQDEFFISTRDHVVDFCSELKRRKLEV